jgi:hypothetical protein
MLSPQLGLSLHDEIFVDNFAGGGGGLAAYFDMVNGRIPAVVVGERPSIRRGKNKGRAQLVQFAGIPGTWVRRGKWVSTCWEGKIG